MRTRIAGVIGLTLLAAVLAACGGSDSGASAPMPAGMPAEMSSEMTGDMAQSKDQMTAGPQVIRTASVTVQVADVQQGAAEVVTVTSQFGGSVQNQDQSNSDGVSYANIAARVPADKLDAYLEAIKGIGEVQYLNVSAADVTPQVLDIEARISSLEASIARLKVLQAQAGNVTDLIAIETELANRQGELDSLKSQRDYYADQVAMSTVTISLTPTSAQGIVTPDFLGGLANGWQALLNVAAFGVTAVGFLLPLLVIAAIVAAVVLVIVRRRRQS